MSRSQVFAGGVWCAVWCGIKAAAVSNYKPDAQGSRQPSCCRKVWRQTELPGGKDECSYPTVARYQWIQTQKRNMIPPKKMFHILTLSLLGIRSLMKSSRWNELNTSLAPFKAASPLSFFMLSEERQLWWEGQTDSKGERRKVCLFFLPFVYLDNSDLSLSLCRRLSASLSLSLLSFCFHFTTQRFPGDDSASGFSLNFLPSVSQFSSTLSCPFVFVCLLGFLVIACWFLLIFPLFDLRCHFWFKYE